MADEHNQLYSGEQGEQGVGPELIDADPIDNVVDGVSPDADGFVMEEPQGNESIPNSAEESRLATDSSELKERLGQHGIEISLNIDKIKNILVDNPRLLEGASPERVAEITKVIETLGSLPEKIEFKPGITLVVGENGAGKSTLTQAVYAVLQARHVGSVLAKRSGDELNDYVRNNTGIKGIGGAYFLDNVSGTISPIAAALSGCIDVADSSYHVGRYNDYTTNAGLSAINRMNEASNMGGITFDNMDPEHAMSHGQSTLNDLRRILAGDYGGLMPQLKGRDGNAIVFLEEPENGLDPRNHQKLIKDLQDIMNNPDNNVVFIVNTNSVLAYQNPNFSRIDLWEPSKGVHTNE